MCIHMHMHICTLTHVRERMCFFYFLILPLFVGVYLELYATANYFQAP